MNKLYIDAIRNTIIGVIVFGLILCLAAGTLGYWQGWLFSVIFLVCTNGQGVYLAIKDPALLERRKNVAADAQTTAQRVFLIGALLANVVMMIVSAFAHRFGWLQVPAFVSIIGDLLVVFSYYIYYLVFNQNTYAASSIQTFEGQKVISTGMYGIVRHPKYVGDLVLVIGAALALGSWVGLIFILLIFPALMWRILDEEKLLRKDLAGYDDYTRKVQYRLVPHLW